jgi:hypothetical protein
VIRNTTVIPAEELLALLPGSLLFRERKLGFEKSYAAYRPILG